MLTASTKVTTESEPNKLAVFTLVLWLLCTALATLGFVFHYSTPREPRRDEPVLAQQLQVELTADTLPPPVLLSPPVELPSPPPPPEAFTSPAAPPPLAVPQPSPAITFPVPLKAPATIIETKLARYTPPVVTNTLVKPAPAPPQPKRLVFGQGEGKQAPPEYPRAALRQGQEGSVLVRVEIREDGSFTTRVESPSPWPLLNEAAFKHVRDRYHFPPGERRIYDIPMRYEITK